MPVILSATVAKVKGGTEDSFDEIQVHVQKSLIGPFIVVAAAPIGNGH